MKKKAKRRTLRERAEEYAERALPDSFWYQPDMEDTYIAGYRAARADARRESKRKEKV